MEQSRAYVVEASKQIIFVSTVFIITLLFLNPQNAWARSFSVVSLVFYTFSLLSSVFVIQKIAGNLIKKPNDTIYEKGVLSLSLYQTFCFGGANLMLLLTGVILYFGDPT